MTNQPARGAPTEKRDLYEIVRHIFQWHFNWDDDERPKKVAALKIYFGLSNTEIEALELFGNDVSDHVLEQLL